MAKRMQKQRLEEFQPPEKKLVRDADLLIKELSKKQTHTQINLAGQLAQEKVFEKFSSILPITNHQSGQCSAEKMKEIIATSSEFEEWKAAGLCDEDVNLYHDFRDGMEVVLKKHPKHEKNLLTKRIEDIEMMLKEYTDKKRSSLINRDKAKSKDISIEKPKSNEAKLLRFALSNRKQPDVLPHPMDTLKELKTNLEFKINLPEVTTPYLNKIRRKARKLQHRLETNKLHETEINNQVNLKSGTLNYLQLSEKYQNDRLEPKQRINPANSLKSGSLREMQLRLVTEINKPINPKSGTSNDLQLREDYQNDTLEANKSRMQEANSLKGGLLSGSQNNEFLTEQSSRQNNPTSSRLFEIKNCSQAGSITPKSDEGGNKFCHKSVESNENVDSLINQNDNISGSLNNAEVINIQCVEKDSDRDYHVLLKNKSKWDIKTAECINPKVNVEEKKVYDCKAQKYYTIRHGEIVPIERVQEINCTGERMTLEEIKRLPKFENYSEGESSNVLYVKNLNRVSIENFKYLCIKYGKITKINDVEFKVMTGRMKGQAFITFPDSTAASFILKEMNGLIVNGKPMIVQYGKKNC